MLCSSFPSNFVYAPSQIETLNFGFSSLSTDYTYGSFWTTKITYALRTSFPNYCFHLDSDQAGSFLLPPFPGPRHKRTLSTLQRKNRTLNSLLKSSNSFKQHQRKSSEQLQLRQPVYCIPLPLAT
ncbi:hypothetical protein ATANTOWER_027496 [Ataeniobius toweri]|uniref:Uncharacterized protein n=1 Tax=Ataeniobius toweri TaxID=208326 RepID=A0ABU7C0S8_9TELE|nr:hypothetical protein [Ataeniobius toweri]